MLGANHSRIVELAELHNLSARFRDAEAKQQLVPVSAVLTTDVSETRFQAVLTTVKASYQAGLTHLIMLDSTSDDQAAQQLRDQGAAVVIINHDTEGGLARPYVIAAQLINYLFDYEVVMVKAEGEKPLFANVENMHAILTETQVRGRDVLTGVRTLATVDTMPTMQALIEMQLGAYIGRRLDVSRDTPSGVLVLGTRRARDLFIETTVDNDWGYLIELPYLAMSGRLVVGEVTVDFVYDPAMVADEEHSKTFDNKRYDQADLMANRADEIRAAYYQKESDSAGDGRQELDMLVRTLRRRSELHHY